MLENPAFEVCVELLAHVLGKHAPVPPRLNGGEERFDVVSDKLVKERPLGTAPFVLKWRGT